MNVLAGVSAALGFLLELACYVSAGYWGFTRRALARPLRLLLAVGAVALLVVVWGQFGAPSGATYPLHGVGRAVLELVWFGAGAAALFAAGRRRLGLSYLALWALCTVLELTVR